MRNARDSSLPVLIDPELKSLIKQACDKTGLKQSEVIRSALRLGMAELMKQSEDIRKPRRNFAEYLGLFAGILRNRNRELVKPSRFAKSCIGSLRPRRWPTDSI